MTKTNLQTQLTFNTNNQTDLQGRHERIVSLHPVHLSSKTNEWGTPSELYEKLNKEFHFTLDPCCTHENAKCERHFTIAEDGLAQDWSRDIVFMNPPYGTKIPHWIKKAYDESAKGATVVCLIPARTDTTYWHNYIFGIAEVRFIKGRIKFIGEQVGSGAAPFPSAIVIFRSRSVGAS